MGWEDPDSLWSRKMAGVIRRHRRLMWLRLGVGVVSVLAFGAVSSDLLVPGINLSMSVTMPLIVLAMFGLPQAIVGLLLWIMRWRMPKLEALLTSVPASDGQLCIVCECPLDEQSRCAKCRRVYDADTIRAFWEQVALAPASAKGQRMAILHHARKAGRGRADPAERPSRPSSGRQVLILGAVAIATLVGTAGFQAGGSALVQIVRILPFVVPMAGFFVGVWLYRSGMGADQLATTRHCPKCGYQRSPEGPNPPHCPECGTPWEGAGGSVQACLDRRPGRIAAGVVLCVLSMGVLVFIPFFSAGTGIVTGTWGSGALPTSSLIKDATTGQMPGSSTWLELAARDLTEDEREALVIGLLERRLDDQEAVPWCPEAEAWMVNQVRAGLLSDDLVQRYYDERLDASLVVPKGPVVVGVPFDVSVSLTARPSMDVYGVGAGTGALFFGGFYIDDADKHVGRRSSHLYMMIDAAEVLNSSKGGTNVQVRAGKKTYSATIHPTQAGPMRVRVEMWEVVGPFSAVSGPVVWNDDGTPVIPAGVTWSKRVELEATVEIVEP